MSEISDKRKLIRDLKEIKDNLSWNLDEEYTNIYNTCVECDNKYGEPYLCDYICEQDFVEDDEYLDELIKHNSSSLERLRYFIGDTYHAELYRVDAYGYLVNVERSDLADLCDELVDMLKDNIKELARAEM